MTVTVGALSLGNIGYHLLIFKDCPEAHHELQTVLMEPFKHANRV
jgi:dolichyl-phosphate mannosyltransferase polypeptide 3